MNLLFVTLVLFVTMAAYLDASCVITYSGLCPGNDNCVCTLGESCGGANQKSCDGNATAAQDKLGGCSGRCVSVTHDRCTGGNNCLLEGGSCGGPGPAPSPPSGVPSRDTIIARAQEWCDKRIPYCQCGPVNECCGSCPYCGTYRCDCSGYASWCLELGHGYTTRSLPEVTHSITKDELLPGDLMLNEGVHVVIFDGWTNAEKTFYSVYQEPGCHQQSGPHYAYKSVVPYPFSWGGNAFKPRRRNGLNKNNVGSAFATDAGIKDALRHRTGYPIKHEQFFLSKVAPSLQNHTDGLMMRLFGKIVPSL